MWLHPSILRCLEGIVAGASDRVHGSAGKGIMPATMGVMAAQGVGCEYPSPVLATLSWMYWFTSPVVI